MQWSAAVPQINVRSAARLIGKDRSTVLRAIESGKLSATRDEHGRFLIDPAELERVYGKLGSADARGNAETAAMPQLASADAARAAALEREVALLREMQRQWEEERTFLRGMLEKQTEQVKLLTDERQQRERHSPPLWARLFRKNA
jgi:hypothetical protein